MTSQNRIPIGDFRVGQDSSGRLTIDVSDFPSSLVFKILAFLSSLQNQENEPPADTPRDQHFFAAEAPQQRSSTPAASQPPRAKKRQNLSEDHPKIKQAMAMARQGISIAEICKQVEISRSSFYLYVKPTPKTTRPE